MTTERFFEFHHSSIDQRRKKETHHSFFSFWESDLTFFESPLHNPTTTTAAAHALFNVLSAWSEVVVSVVVRAFRRERQRENKNIIQVYITQQQQHTNTKNSSKKAFQNNIVEQ